MPRTKKPTYSIYDLIVMTPEQVGKVLLDEIEKSKPNMELIQDLLDLPHVNVNLQDKEGWSALMRASVKGHTEIVRGLLERPEIDVNLQDEIGRITAWGWASQSIRKQFPKLEPKPKKKVLANVVPIIIVEESYGFTAVFPTIPASTLSCYTFITFDNDYGHNVGSIEWYMTTRIAKESDAKTKFLNYLKKLYWEYDAVELKEYKRWMPSFDKARMQEWSRTIR